MTEEPMPDPQNDIPNPNQPQGADGPLEGPARDAMGYDGRMTDVDGRVAAALDDASLGSPRPGFVDRVVAASLPLLAEGRARGPHRLRWPIVVGRLAAAAALGLAIMVGFWSTPQGEELHRSFTSFAAAPGERPTGMLVASGPFKWRDGPMLTLLRVKDLGYEDALGDLETVVNAVGSGQTAVLGIVSDEGPLDRVESELLTVTNIAGGAS